MVLRKFDCSADHASPIKNYTQSLSIGHTHITKTFAILYQYLSSRVKKLIKKQFLKYIYLDKVNQNELTLLFLWQNVTDVMQK